MKDKTPEVGDGVVRINKLAKLLGVTSSEVIETANALGIDVRHHASALDEHSAGRIKQAIEEDQKKKMDDGGEKYYVRIEQTEQIFPVGKDGTFKFKVKDTDVVLHNCRVNKRGNVFMEIPEEYKSKGFDDQILWYGMVFSGSLPHEKGHEYVNILGHPVEHLGLRVPVQVVRDSEVILPEDHVNLIKTRKHIIEETVADKDDNGRPSHRTTRREQRRFSSQFERVFADILPQSDMSDADKERIEAV